MKNAEGTQILRPGEIAVLFPCRHYVLSPLWELSDIAENRMIRIRVLLSDLSVVYCDKNGKLWDCEFPDLYELFDTEEEFIKYIKTLKLKKEEKRLLD